MNKDHWSGYTTPPTVNHDIAALHRRAPELLHLMFVALANGDEWAANVFAREAFFST